MWLIPNDLLWFQNQYVWERQPRQSKVLQIIGGNNPSISSHSQLDQMVIALCYFLGFP
jgi:hypothetical protein